MMLMVIFGAGASYDSSPTYAPGTAPSGHEAYRPPLAKDLFENRPLFINALETFPQCKPIVPRLRDPGVRSGKVSIETRLQEIESEANTYAPALRELAAVRCYIQRAISECASHWPSVTKGITNHRLLLREVDRMVSGNEPVCLVTFNYDTLLEEALLDFGLRIERMEDYTRHPRFYVFKLHGSITWAQEVNIELPDNIIQNEPTGILNYLIDQAGELRVLDSYVLCDSNQMGLVNARPVFPAIAVPVEKKQVFQCPKYMVEHLAALLPQITKILIIGWRATEQHFLHFLNQFLGSNTSMAIVAATQGDVVDAKGRIDRVLLDRTPRLMHQAEGFTKFMLDRGLERFLSA